MEWLSDRRQAPHSEPSADHAHSIARRQPQARQRRQRPRRLQPRAARAWIAASIAASTAHEMRRRFPKRSFQRRARRCDQQLAKLRHPQAATAGHSPRRSAPPLLARAAHDGSAQRGRVRASARRTLRPLGEEGRPRHPLQDEPQNELRKKLQSRPQHGCETPRARTHHARRRSFRGCLVGQPWLSSLSTRRSEVQPTRSTGDLLEDCLQRTPSQHNRPRNSLQAPALQVPQRTHIDLETFSSALTSTPPLAATMARAPHRQHPCHRPRGLPASLSVS